MPNPNFLSLVMRNFSFIQICSSFSVNNSVNSVSRMAVLKNEMSYGQSRTFGPWTSLFLVNLFAKLIGAKYFSYVPYQFPYTSGPWVPYVKPSHGPYVSQWYPIKNPYDHYGTPAHQPYPMLTTPAPYLPPDYENDYHGGYEYPSNQHFDHDTLVPAESNNVVSITTESNLPVSTTHIPTESKLVPSLGSSTTEEPTTTTELPTTTDVTITTEEPVAAGSSFKARRQPTQKYKRRVTPSRRDKYPQRRRRPTTPPPEYYDSYEEYTERYPNRNRKPTKNRHSDESYYYDNDEYDYVETTTRAKKQKRRPTRKVNKNQQREEDSVEIIPNISSTTEKFNPNTEIVIVRQAMPTSPTTPTTTTTTEGTTTTEPTTIITNTTVSSTTSGYNNGTYGYGPSNGNEHVSFTYAPPTGNYQYQVPYVDWYAQEATRNAIVKKVNDIVQDDRFNFK